jgi:N,N'-diacetylchitobiose phosphorylase
MVSAHAVYCLMLAADLFRTVAAKKPNPDLLNQAQRFEKAAQAFKTNLLKHALNTEGYFNAVFNDAGKWLFSPKDPDGQYRINSTPNTFAVIAGIVQGKTRDKVFEMMNRLKGPYGWRLFYPGVSGNPPIEKMGRIGHGDLAVGLGENGCPYNHGSHGFLGRAAWSAGKGDLFYQIMRYQLPYDQEAHPVQSTHTAPFAILNNYLEGVGLEGRGGDPFGTGSTPVAARNVFDGFLGFRPNLHYLVIDPVMPAAWSKSGGAAHFLGGLFRISIQNPNHVEAGVKQLLLDGKPAGQRYMDPILGREVMGIPIDSLKPGENHEIVVTLG